MVELQTKGLGTYFLESLNSDIESLKLFAGIHSVQYGRYFRLLSKRFPFGVYYTISENTVLIHAILDCRRDPAWMRDRLK